MPEYLLNYFDYEAYGRDISINEGGHFTPGGYIVQAGGDFKEFYHGTRDFSNEHGVFSCPKLSVREQLKEEAAKVVRLIFRLFLDGNNRTQIAIYLTREQIPTPMFYMKGRDQKRAR